jgi:hypothetical protein
MRKEQENWEVNGKPDEVTVSLPLLLGELAFFLPNDDITQKNLVPHNLTRPRFRILALTAT